LMGPQVLFASRSFGKMIGVDTSDIQGSSFLSLVAPEDMVRASAFLERVASNMDVIVERLRMRVEQHDAKEAEVMAAGSDEGTILLCQMEKCGNVVDSSGCLSLEELISSDPETSDVASDWHRVMHMERSTSHDDTRNNNDNNDNGHELMPLAYIAVHDKTPLMRLLYASSNIRSATQFTPSEVVGRSAFSFIKTRQVCEYKTHFGHQQSDSIVVRNTVVNAKDGSAVYMRIIHFSCDDIAFNVAMVYPHMAGRSARRAIEERCRAHEAVYRCNRAVQ
ncbi:hypothetical protein GGI05_006861, partial [Coemansia sp. RSA 2603]